MLLERAEILVKPGLEDEFAKVMHEQAVPILAAATGVQSVKFGRGVEHPEKFMLLVAWSAMDAHKAFTKSPDFPTFRALIGAHSTGGAMEHFEMDGSAPWI